MCKDMGQSKERAFMKPGRTNKEDRLNFIEFWANYVRTHSDEEWSRQQSVLIDSVIKSAREKSEKIRV